MRLDIYLTEQGLFKSRSKARSAVDNGNVLVNGKKEKPSFDIDGSENIEVLVKDRFVSRAGEKLEHALDTFNIDVSGLTVLDIGASTGGFTHCLLLKGAKKVYALDVGTAQLAKELLDDKRVISIENYNARYAKKEDFDDEIDMIVMDVSFISQTLIYPACKDILSLGKRMITLIKPQFEAGKENIGKGGIVKDSKGEIIKEILEKLDICAQSNGFIRTEFTESPIEGGDGNREYLGLFIRKE